MISQRFQDREIIRGRTKRREGEREREREREWEQERYLRRRDWKRWVLQDLMRHRLCNDARFRDHGISYASLQQLAGDCFWLLKSGVTTAARICEILYSDF
jgi:hypothetical protein